MKVKSKEDVSKCGTCKKPVGDQDDGVYCEICELWFHCRCQGISDGLYIALSQFKSELHWFCNSCNTGAGKLLKTISKMHTKVEKLEDEMARMKADLQADMIRATSVIKDGLAKLETRVEQCESKADTNKQELHSKVDDIKSKLDSPLSSVVQGCIEGAVKSQLTEDNAEAQEIQRRKTSVIAHGIPELDADTANERNESDIIQIAAMLEELDVNGAKVEQVIRLGKRPESVNSKPRPLKIVFDTEDNKIQVIRKAKNLRDKKDGGWESVFVHQDLTPKQREVRNKLVQELKSRVAQGEKDLVIYRGEIVKRRGC